jgi:peptidoglycan/xylan/chitin deacetylase (PgdA/CDA1 family)
LNGFAEGCGDVKTGGIRRRIAWGMLLILMLLVSVWAESPEEKEQQPKGYIALTFDDGPSGALTEQLLDGLRQRNARATFFLCGYRMEQYPSALSRYLEGGHELGVHSTVHTDLTKLTPQEVQQDMAQTAGKIRELTGISPVVMRPPGGAYDETVCREAGAEGMSVILWSVDPRDWASHDAGAVLHTMAREAGDGDVILMHDLSKSSVEAALRLVDLLEEKGYCFVTVSELAALRGTELEPGNVYTDFAEK